MISVSQVLNTVEPILVTQSLAEALQIIDVSGLPGLPVVDKDHKLLGIAFKETLLGVDPQIPLGKC